MNNTMTLDTILQDIQDGNIDAAFDADLEIQSLIVGDGLDYTGYIITKSGAFKSYDFSFETMAPPSAAQLIRAYVKTVKENISIQEAVYKLYHVQKSVS